MNERITENIVRDELEKKGYRSDETITIEEQKSQNPIIQKCLKNASKSGKGSGKPEFLIQSACLAQSLPTKRVPDMWESARFRGIFLASAFSSPQTESTPTHTQVTQAVGKPSKDD